MTAVVPTLALERRLAAGPGEGGEAADAAAFASFDRLRLDGMHRPADIVVGFDEVGRGALAGPVMVGAAAVWARDLLDDDHPLAVPAGVADSKMLTEHRREAIYDELGEWCAAWAVGQASNAEIDDWGISHALGVAALRALGRVERLLGIGDDGCLHLAAPARSAEPVRATAPADGSRPAAADPEAVLGEEVAACGAAPAAGMPAGRPVRMAGILDGPHDYITKAIGSFDAPDVPAPPHMVTVVKGDQKCASVATAAVLAKVTRDRLMEALAARHAAWEPYAWERNKGYGSAAHKAAIAAHGPTRLHRVSWKLV